MSLVDLTPVVCPRHRSAGAGSFASPVLLQHLHPTEESGLPDARHDSLCWNIAEPSCFYTVLVLFRLQDFRSLFANGESGVRHRSVSSAAASPCEQPGGRRLRVSGGAEMDRGERRHTAGGLRAPQVFGCLSDGVQPDLGSLSLHSDFIASSPVER